MTAITLKAKSETLAARIERAAHLAYLDGATEDAISDELGIKPVTLRDWKKRPEWRGAIDLLRQTQEEAVLDRLSRLTEKAANAVEECLDSENDGVRLKAAQWVLDRGAALFNERSPITRSGSTGEIENFIKMVLIDAKAKN